MQNVISSFLRILLHIKCSPLEHLHHKFTKLLLMVPYHCKLEEEQMWMPTAHFTWYKNTQVLLKKKITSTLSHSTKHWNCYCMNIISKMSQQTTVNVSNIASTMKKEKGKNFVTQEERSFCCSILHVSQDPINKYQHPQTCTTFWD